MISSELPTTTQTGACSGLDMQLGQVSCFRAWPLRGETNRMRASVVLLAVLIFASSGWSQNVTEGASVFGNLSAKELDGILASRTAAHKELAEKSATFDPPDIAIALGAERYLIVIAKINSVQLPTVANAHTIVTFHVEQFLRGESQVTDFSVESHWNPNKEQLLFTVVSNYRETALDKSEPKAGNRYILGYTLEYGVEKYVFVPSVVDLQDPAQAEMIANVKRFLDLETEAGLRGFATYLEALDDKVPWIRDIAVHRLTYSDACNASSICRETFSAAVKRQLQSNSPNERGEAIGWLIWIDSVSKQERKRKRYVEGLPILPDSELRVLLEAAVQDRNVELGDRAFQAREMFDFHRNGSSGECIELVAPLRKSVRWPSKHDPVPTAYPSYTYACIPPQ